MTWAFDYFHHPKRVRVNEKFNKTKPETKRKARRLGSGCVGFLATATAEVIHPDVQRIQTMASIAPSDDMWGDFDADIAAQPAVGVDPSTSWFTIACVYLFLPLHLLVTFVAFKVPAVGRALASAAIVYYQSGVAGGPDKRNPFIVPAVIWSTLSSLATFIVKFKGQRFQLYEFVHKTYGGQGWGWFTEGPGRFGYEVHCILLPSPRCAHAHPHPCAAA